MRRSPLALSPLSLSLFALSLLLQTGCVGTFSHTGLALIDVHTDGGNATGASLGTRSGEACSMNILGIISVGDGSIKSAARDAGITHISTVDFHYLNILGLFGRVCTLVSGESEPFVPVPFPPPAPPLAPAPVPPPAPAPAATPAPGNAAAGPQPAAGACAKDVDCKGDRICTKGRCTAP
ncbi:MAG: TRL-like family protein [Polyangiaceae bacterium]|jgi:hypothetical protein